MKGLVGDGPDWQGPQVKWRGVWELGQQQETSQRAHRQCLAFAILFGAHIFVPQPVSVISGCRTLGSLSHLAFLLLVLEFRSSKSRWDKVSFQGQHGYWLAEGCLFPGFSNSLPW